MTRRDSARKRLDRLLDARNEHPEQLQAIDTKICAAFEQTLAILVLDMCGFSRLTLHHGIVHFLALIRRMHHAVIPLIESKSGRVVKIEADNLFVTFADVRSALGAAQAVQRQLTHDNRVLPKDWDVRVGIGIGFGPTLVIGDDLYGAEMNLASKLGEDVANAGEILLTDAAFARAGQAKRSFRAHRTRFGALPLRYHALRLPSAR